MFSSGAHDLREIEGPDVHADQSEIYRACYIIERGPKKK